MTGIYCIKNLINNKIYVGQSVDIFTRWRKHKEKLIKGTHENSHLQNSFNKYGINNFDFCILEQCSKKELDDKEIYWINKYDSFNNGYNLTSGGSGIKDWIPSSEWKEQVKQRVQGENNPNYGHHWTKQMKDYLSNIKKGKNLRGDNPNSIKVICVETLKVYECLLDAATDIGLKSGSSISLCLKDKTRVANGYHFVEYEKDFLKYLTDHQFDYLFDCYSQSKQCKIADITNKKFYTKAELKRYFSKNKIMTTRAFENTFNKTDNFEINGIKYILL